MNNPAQDVSDQSIAAAFREADGKWFQSQHELRTWVEARARELQQAKAVGEAWQKGYRGGVEDERTSEANIGIAGYGAKIEPARANPYTAPTRASEAGVGGSVVGPPGLITPNWVLESAHKIELWMKVHGYDNWQLGGIQSRDFTPNPPRQWRMRRWFRFLATRS